MRRRCPPWPTIQKVSRPSTGASLDAGRSSAKEPRAPKSKKDFWQADVMKMIKVYGAPIDDADVGKIVDYLAATY
jgi:hypothetical protein